MLKRCRKCNIVQSVHEINKYTDTCNSCDSQSKKPSTVKIDHKTAWQGFFAGVQKDPRKAYSKAEILAMRDFYEDIIHDD